MLVGADRAHIGKSGAIVIDAADRFPPEHPPASAGTPRIRLAA
ncbi:hypothetical protein [Microbacterium soli]